MRIKKRPIKAENLVDENLVDVAVVEEPAEEVIVAEPAVPCYGECIDYIHKAIDCLAACANSTGDEKAKEAIANLSVVLLDLQ